MVVGLSVSRESHDETFGIVMAVGLSVSGKQHFVTIDFLTFKMVVILTTLCH